LKPAGHLAKGGPRIHDRQKQEKNMKPKPPQMLLTAALFCAMAATTASAAEVPKLK
jgi:hypothetical protein